MLRRNFLKSSLEFLTFLFISKPEEIIGGLSILEEGKTPPPANKPFNFDSQQAYGWYMIFNHKSSARDISKCEEIFRTKVLPNSVPPEYYNKFKRIDGHFPLGLSCSNWEECWTIGWKYVPQESDVPEGNGRKIFDIKS